MFEIILFSYQRTRGTYLPIKDHEHFMDFDRQILFMIPHAPALTHGEGATSIQNLILQQ